MLYEDNEGRLYMPDDVDELSVWEIEEKGIHVSHDFEFERLTNSHDEQITRDEDFEDIPIIPKGGKAIT